MPTIPTDQKIGNAKIAVGGYTYTLTTHGGGAMRVLMFSKACIVGVYQRKLEEIARLGG